ncbi:hypothetical protein NQ318_022046 [Aromia moschata]|uniref:Tc1-like transposase DDE domain-containing protein n=1 Tax=Aromia moschata TaxID=1265417 RepID=A0AAV8Z5A2_9CUCU|nr:hypothetical protein NQ318_022046 [Aromia moschata]
MDEQNIPIDINTSKLLDWLISRRHVNKNWQNSVLKIREKINNAIQDMPAHEGIVKLLSGQHINYFHCLKIVEILKETEADTKNLFGRYGSQRMKDWQDIISSYQKDNVYLAEVAQMLIRNVNYEIPSLRKQVAKLEQSQLECEKKIKDYSKVSDMALKEFNSSCEQLGISGTNIKTELIELLKELPTIYDVTTEKIKIVKLAIELYTEFNKFLSGSGADVEVLPILKYLVRNGNTTTYEYVYGEKPIKIEESPILAVEGPEHESDSIDFGDNVGEIDFEISTDDNAIDFGETAGGENQDIDWEVNLEESGIVVEKSGLDGGVATGDEALSLLDNPKTHEQIINNLVELSAFLKMRLHEMSSDSDLLAMSQMQDAPTILQMQTIESITTLNDCVNVALDQLTNKRIQHLHNIKHSPKYLDILTASLKQKLSVVEKMKASKATLERKIKDLREEARNVEPVIKLLIEKTKQLQKDIQDDISAKYKGVGVASVYNILREYKSTNGLQPTKAYRRQRVILDNIDEETKCAVRCLIHSFFVKNEVPTIKNILAAIKENDVIPNFRKTTFKCLLRKIGFRYGKRRNSYLKERKEIIFWRRHYLREVKRIREQNKKIYYVHQRWVNAEHVLNETWMGATIGTPSEAVNGYSTGLKLPSGKGKQLLIIHIASEEGFLENGLFVFESKNKADTNEDTIAQIFEDWFKTVLSHLEEGCVIVMDNAPYQNRKVEKIPKSSTKKADVQAWLRSRNIVYEEDMVKAELLVLVKNNKPEDRYVVEGLAEATGRSVLRLPPYHCELNPTELIWQQIKEEAATYYSTFELPEVKVLLQQAIDNITLQDWDKAIDHVLKVEQRMWSVDVLMETRYEPINIDSDGTSSDSDSDE